MNRVVACVITEEQVEAAMKRINKMTEADWERMWSLLGHHALVAKDAAARWRTFPLT